jgi:epoxyqueuosine reductase QueG
MATFSGMIPESLRLKEKARSLGADFVGIADPAGFLDPGYKGCRPQDFMPWIRSIIVIGVVIPKGCVQPLPMGRPEYTNTLMAGTATLRVIAFRIARDLEKQGYLASLVPTEGSEFGTWYADKETLKADLSLKYAAWLAGIGEYGLNQLLITRETGPRIRMTAILTDAALEPDHPTGKSFIRPECASCRKCVNVCPVKALSADGTIQAHLCRDCMFTTLGGLRCGMCLRVCPL